MVLTVGQMAPEFTAFDQDGRAISLADYRGKWVVLYFYPKDNTSGCTREACAFRDAMEEVTSVGAVVIGVSPDSVRSHRNFADKYNLPFRLVADEDHQIAQAYGVWKEKTLYGRTSWGIERTTFIIAPDGRIAAIFPKVKVDGHVEQVLETLRAFQR
ncbi:MAG: thioredoxin-dependent thiol peroxidase [Chlorobiota bacterium]|nr:MAG: thioredoxin-dependent thiol peroxidase [Chlorobiota bacterium]